jgi:Flp pilus assembly protein TadB
VASTRKRRQTKHRGNAAGVVESRGRTGRKPTAAEKSGDARDKARAKQRLLDKRDRPPTWRGAFTKAMIAAIALLVFGLLFLKNAGSTIGLFPIVLVIYTLISYYTDRFIYNRRQRVKARQGGGGRAASQ